MLAVPWAIVKCRLFLAGLPHFKIITDHHPLVHNLNKNRLDEIKNLMLQRLKTRIMGYCFTAKWINGTLMPYLVALCRIPHHQSHWRNRSLITEMSSLVPRFVSYMDLRLTVPGYRNSVSRQPKTTSTSNFSTINSINSISIAVNCRKHIATIGVYATSSRWKMA